MELTIDDMAIMTGFFGNGECFIGNLFSIPKLLCRRIIIAKVDIDVADILFLTNFFTELSACGLPKYCGRMRVVPQLLQVVAFLQCC